MFISNFVIFTAIKIIKQRIILNILINNLKLVKLSITDSGDLSPGMKVVHWYPPFYS